jgi:type IV pilus secretin PilQ/predicted competence protein
MCLALMLPSLFAGIPDTATALPGDPAVRQRVNLNLEEAGLLDALKLIIAPQGLNLVLGSGVEGTVTVQLNNVTFEEAMRSVLAVNGLTYFQQNNTVYVIREAEAVQVAPDLLSLDVETFEINYAPLTEMQTIIESFLSPAGKLLISPTMSTLVVEDTPSNLGSIGALVESLDVPPRQVLIRAHIVDVTLDDDTALGIEWDYLKASDVVSDAVDMDASATLKTEGFSPTLSEGLFFSFATSGFEAFLDALQQRTAAEVLASPTVLALDGKQAEIIIGSKLGFRLLTTSPTGQTMETIEFLDVGTQLTLTPHIGDDGLVVMDVHPEVSDGVIDQGLPSETTTETTTSLIVQDGTTILIGGLIRHREEHTRSQVPILGSIPVLGYLFRKSTATDVRSEVLVGITPYVVSPQGSDEMSPELGRLQEIQGRRWEPGKGAKAEVH